VAARLQASNEVTLDLPSGPVTLEHADFFKQAKAPEGWTGVADGGTQVALDVRLTESLAQEGMAREVVRHIQELRKTAKLQLEDRIVLHLSTSSKPLLEAIGAFKAYIMSETLATGWSEQPLGQGAASVDVKVDGQPLHVELKTASQ